MIVEEAKKTSFCVPEFMISSLNIQVELWHNPPPAILHCQVPKFLPALVCHASYSQAVEDVLDCLGCAVSDAEHGRRAA